MSSVPIGLNAPSGNSELYTLNQIMNLPAPALAWKWRVTAAVFPSGISIPLEYFHAVPITFPAIEAVPFHRQATTHTIPGFESIGTISMTLYEDDSYFVTRVLQRWKTLIKDDAGLYTIPFPSGTMEVTCYNTQNQPTMRAKLFSIWPSSQSPSELSYDNNQRLIVTAEFSLNRVRIIPGESSIRNIPSSSTPQILPATPPPVGPPTPTFPRS